MEHAKVHQAAVSLTDALAVIDRTEPVAPHAATLTEAVGLTLADDATVAGAKLRLAGARLRRIDVALLSAAGVTSVNVRVPRLLIISKYAHAKLIAGAIAGEGGVAEPSGVDPDAIIAIGDANGEALKAASLEFDGVAMAPGGAIGFGYAYNRPVLLLPDSFDAMLAGWLMIGRRLLARLAFRLIEDQPFYLELARAIPSERGTAEIIAVRRRAAQAEPMPNEWTADNIARADGWILVSADSNGLAAGTLVQMRPWP